MIHSLHLMIPELEVSYIFLQNVTFNLDIVKYNIYLL